MIDLSILPRTESANIDLLELENVLGIHQVSSPVLQVSSPINLDILPIQRAHLDLDDSVEFNYMAAIGNSAVLIELRSNARQEIEIVEAAINSRVAAITEDEIRAEAARLWRADVVIRKRLLKKDRERA